LRLADCSDWHVANKASRELTILRLRSFYGSDVTAGNAGGQHGSGSVLENRRAYQLFEKSCAQPFAAAFKLYKLYGRAAGFSGARQ